MLLYILWDDIVFIVRCHCIHFGISLYISCDVIVYIMSRWAIKTETISNPNRTAPTLTWRKSRKKGDFDAYLAALSSLIRASSCFIDLQNETFFLPRPILRSLLRISRIAPGEILLNFKNNGRLLFDSFSSAPSPTSNSGDGSFELINGGRLRGLL